MGITWEALIFEIGGGIRDGNDLKTWIPGGASAPCGQCTPCREGTSWLEDVLERIMRGDGRPEDIDLLLDVSDNISPGLTWPPAMTTICPLGPSATAPITSIMKYFRDEVEAMIPAAAQPAEAAHA